MKNSTLNKGGVFSMYMSVMLSVNAIVSVKH